MAPLFETLKLLHAQTSILYNDILSAPIAKTAGRLRSCYTCTSTKSSWRRHSSEVVHYEVESRIYEKRETRTLYLKYIFKTAQRSGREMQ